MPLFQSCELFLELPRVVISPNARSFFVIPHKRSDIRRCFVCNTLISPKRHPSLCRVDWKLLEQQFHRAVVDAGVLEPDQLRRPPRSCEEALPECVERIDAMMLLAQSRGIDTHNLRLLKALCVVLSAFLNPGAEGICGPIDWWTDSFGLPIDAVPLDAEPKNSDCSTVISRQLTPAIDQVTENAKEVVDHAEKAGRGFLRALLALETEAALLAGALIVVLGAVGIMVLTKDHSTKDFVVKSGMLAVAGATAISCAGAGMGGPPVVIAGGIISYLATFVAARGIAFRTDNPTLTDRQRREDKGWDQWLGGIGFAGLLLAGASVWIAWKIKTESPSE